jgi:ribosomal protein S18 acetylase RimI-like enzyme
MLVRSTTQEDIPAIKKVLDETGLFPSEALADMIQSYFSELETPDIWLTCELEHQGIGFCYAMPETATDGTWNMLAIAVLPSLQGSGAGAAIVTTLEATLRATGNRVLIVDTSAGEVYAKARQFYRGIGYTEEARIREFWAAGDDKIVFWKSLVG